MPKKKEKKPRAKPNFVSHTITKADVEYGFAPLGNGLLVKISASEKDIGKELHFNLNGGSLDLLYNTTA